MQHLNDDMDELFRKAADDYPLNVGTPDWNKIQAALDGNVNIKTNGKKNYKRFTWLLLLLPLGFLLYYISVGNNTGFGKIGTASDSGKLTSEREANTEVAKTEKSKTEVSKSNESKSDESKSDELKSDELKSDESKSDESKSDESRSDESKKNVSETDILKSDLSRTDISKTDPSGSDVSKTGKVKVDVSTRNIPNTGGKSDKKNSKPSGLKKDVFEKNIPTSDKPIADRLQSGVIKDNSIYNKYDRNSIKNDISKQTVKSPLKTILSDRSNNGLIDGVSKTDFTVVDDDNSALFPFTPTAQIIAITGLPIEPINDPAHFDGIQLAGKRVLPPVKKNNPRFYIGAIGGLDFTTVKLQKFSNLGSHYGAIAGFQLSKKWSVETGFFVEKKFYYTDGDYFDKRRMTINPNSKIRSIDGECNMFEIPVSVKYDISNTFRSTWFVTGGFSTYIMKEENYNMLYQYGSSTTLYPHNYVYKNSSKNFFSEIRFTGGYSYKLRSNFSLRVEPYLNVPISGVGYGKLSLISAGVNAGIFKRIF